MRGYGGNLGESEGYGVGYLGKLEEEMQERVMNLERGMADMLGLCCNFTIFQGLDFRERKFGASGLEEREFGTEQYTELIIFSMFGVGRGWTEQGNKMYVFFSGKDPDR